MRCSSVSCRGDGTVVMHIDLTLKINGISMIDISRMSSLKDQVARAKISIHG